MRAKGLSTITDDLVRSLGANIVRDYYYDSIQKISISAAKYLEDNLLTDGGYRDSVARDKIERSKQISKQEVETLLSCRIIKEETLNDVKRIEFTHDVLSKYALEHKMERENSKKWLVALCSFTATLIIAAYACCRMDVLLTTIFLPILPIISSLSLLLLFKIPLRPSMRIALPVSSCMVGVIYACCQHFMWISVISYYLLPSLLLFVLVLYAFGIKRQTSNIHVLVKNYGGIFSVWLVSCIIIPTACFGYNIWNGLNYIRVSDFSQGKFIVENKLHLKGIRDRKKIILKPSYETFDLQKNGTCIVGRDGKYGMLSSSFEKIIEPQFDSILIEDGIVYRYVKDRVAYENGLTAKWDKYISSDKKKIMNKIITNMVLIKGGTFYKGDYGDENAYHTTTYKSEKCYEVTLSDFYISKYEVTIEDWVTLAGYKPKIEDGTEKDCPISNVAWTQCLSFIENIKSLSDVNFDFPTEAQWEYAAKGGSKGKYNRYSGSNNAQDAGWLGKNSNDKLHPVGEKVPNEYGLFDMTGNVMEWCMDFMWPDPYNYNRENPVFKKSRLERKYKGRRVYKGGCYLTKDEDNARNAYRAHSLETERGQSKSLGLRLAVSLTKYSLP